MRVRGTIVVIGLIFVGSLVTGCEGDRGVVATSAPVATYEPNGESVQSLSIDNNFLPQTLTVVAGTEVLFVNNGRNAHNVLPEGDPQATTWGVLEAAFEPGDTYARVFDTPGTYVYYCSIHGTATAGMFGSIIVTAP